MKKSVLAVVLLFATLSAWAGDVAVFKNLGFSPDSRYFQFAQYGIDSNTQSPWVETYTVDVIRNRFVPGGYHRSLFPVGITLGDDGLKALLAHLEKYGPERSQWHLDYLQQGRPIYFRVTGEATSQDYDNFSVLDYKTGRTYIAHVKKSVKNQGASVSSSYYIDLEIHDKSGKVLGTYKVGNPAFWRSGVRNYTITEMILAPNDRSMVFVIEKEEDDGHGGVNLRSMVETAVLNN